LATATRNSIEYAMPLDLHVQQHEYNLSAKTALQAGGKCSSVIEGAAHGGRQVILICRSRFGAQLQIEPVVWLGHPSTWFARCHGDQLRSLPPAHALDFLGFVTNANQTGRIACPTFPGACRFPASQFSELLLSAMLRETRFKLEWKSNYARTGSYMAQIIARVPAAAGAQPLSRVANWSRETRAARNGSSACTSRAVRAKCWVEVMRNSLHASAGFLRTLVASQNAVMRSRVPWLMMMAMNATFRSASAAHAKWLSEC